MNRQEILKTENLDGWSIKEITSGGGLCLHKYKEIWIDKTAGDAMFLHEVAHALTYEWDERLADPTGHHSVFADKFTELVDKYMVSKQMEKYE